MQSGEGITEGVGLQTNVPKNLTLDVPNLYLHLFALQQILVGIGQRQTLVGRRDPGKDDVVTLSVDIHGDDRCTVQNLCLQPRLYSHGFHLDNISVRALLQMQGVETLALNVPPLEGLTVEEMLLPKSRLDMHEEVARLLGQQVTGQGDLLAKQRIGRGRPKDLQQVKGWTGRYKDGVCPVAEKGVGAKGVRLYLPGSDGQSMFLQMCRLNDHIDRRQVHG